MRLLRWYPLQCVLTNKRLAAVDVHEKDDSDDDSGRDYLGEPESREGTRHSGEYMQRGHLGPLSVLNYQGANF